MDAKKPGSREDSVPSAGELIVQSGRRKGARQPLGVPLTFIGRSRGCDIRLNADGVEPMHCLVVQGPDGLILRDLESTSGSFVNGQRVKTQLLREGDLLTIGQFQFQVRLSEAATKAATPTVGQREAMRVQAAAVAAHQAGLEEEEARLLLRRDALEQQEEQLAAHLEEKRKKLQNLSEKAQAQREALNREKHTYEKHVAQVTGDLSQAQRELLDSQQKVQRERKRLGKLYRKLRDRWSGRLKAERRELQLHIEELAARNQQLDQESIRLQQVENRLANDRLVFQGEYELGRRHLQEAWQRVRGAQKAWRQRRAQERLALRLRARELEGNAALLNKGQEQLTRDQQNWASGRLDREKELEGLENRIRNQRHKVFDQQIELDQLESQLRESRGMLEGPSTFETPVKIPVETGDNSPQADPRCPDLDRLAGELADQRLHLTEQWKRLAQVQDHWVKHREQVTAELEGVIHKVQEREQELLSREQTLETQEAGLEQRHEELVLLRQHLIAWRARLRTRENSWEGERNHLVAELKHREALTQEHLRALVDLRQRWARRRRQELDQVRADRAVCASLRQEYVSLRQELAQRLTALDEDKRILAEKTLALEEYRQEVLTQDGNSPGAERRIERLRRRWITQNAAILRGTAREREQLKVDLEAWSRRAIELDRRAEEITSLESSLAEKLTSWEHKQILAGARDARLEHELQLANARRTCTEQELERMKEEVERIARALLEEPDAPALTTRRAA